MNTPQDDSDTIGIDSSPSDEEISPDEGSKESPESDEVPGKKSAESRINELVGKVKELEESLEAKNVPEENGQGVPMPDTELKITPEIQRAIDHLRNLGFVHKTELKTELDSLKERSIIEGEHTRLSSTYSGSDGRPKYDKKEVEEYMLKKSVYDPEVAYKALHETELLDWSLKQADGKKKERPYVEKRGQVQLDREGNSITREMIADWMKTPEGRVKYEKNRDKILTLLAQGQL